MREKKNLLRAFILISIKFYKVFISTCLGNNCRFYPSCSEYFFQAVEIYGVIKGCRLGISRIFRCNPWNDGGVDMVSCKENYKCDDYEDGNRKHHICGNINIKSISGFK